MTESKDVFVSSRVSRDFKEHLARMARRKRRSLSDYIRITLETATGYDYEDDDENREKIL